MRAEAIEIKDAYGRFVTGTNAEEATESSDSDP